MKRTLALCLVLALVTAGLLWTLGITVGPNPVYLMLYAVVLSLCYLGVTWVGKRFDPGVNVSTYGTIYVGLTVLLSGLFALLTIAWR
jgi:hypothetical protein